MINSSRIVQKIANLVEKNIGKKFQNSSVAAEADPSPVADQKNVHFQTEHTTNDRFTPQDVRIDDALRSNSSQYNINASLGHITQENAFTPDTSTLQQIDTQRQKPVINTGQAFLKYTVNNGVQAFSTQQHALPGINMHVNTNLTREQNRALDDPEFIITRGQFLNDSGEPKYKDQSDQELKKKTRRPKGDLFGFS